ncbi:CHAT domain-containing protein [Marixanthomonas spongiae]|uniref:CHAT domain-containing protein n=1 Tax=Marixanthomonas spongiae TaxID=2174845 RepID=A0A2U0HZG0_9FLAO|nr:CHAT domain-containing protein [Marixanthomonas spongiae]PVW14209.1 hypothetical protein DDV96_10395 [Marixanthomonas spongiae]
MEILNRNIVCFALLFFALLPCFSQKAETDTIYKKLDVFLEEPSVKNTLTLKDYLENLSKSSQEVQLAKTVAYCNLGYVASKKGAFQQAIDYYETAKQLYFSETLAGYDIIEYCLKPLGNLYTKAGALSEAENTITHYLLLAQEHDQTEQEISAILNLSVLYHNRGEYNKAVQLLRQGLKKTPQNQDLQLNLATNYVGLGYLEEAKKMVSSLLNASRTNSKAFQILAQVYRLERQYDKAISAIKKAIEIASKKRDTDSREQAKLYLGLAETYFENKETERSLSTLQKVYLNTLPTYKRTQEVPLTEQLIAETILMDALDLHAMALVRTHNLKKSIALFEKAFTVHDYLFAQLYVQDSKLIAQQLVKQRTEHMMDVLYSLYKTTQDSQWFEKAIQLDNRVKGRVVFEAIALKKILGKKAGQQATEFQQLREQLAVTNNQIKALAHHPNPDYKKLGTLQKTYSKLLTRQRTVYDSIQQTMPGLQNVRSVHLKEIKQKASQTEKTILSYFLGKNKTFQFIISAEKKVFKRLTASEKEQEALLHSIRSYNRFFNDPATINNNISAFTAASYGLFKKLELPPSKTLLIIPDGLLSFVPFQTLLTQQTQSQQYSEMPFLVFDRSVSYTVSFQHYMNNNGTFTDKQSVLGVFPVFKNTEQELHYSIMEAEAIDELFPSQLLMGNKATAQHFLQNANHHSILHISTHAVGGTFTTEPKIKFIDRSFSLETLYGGQFSQQLVVLSACETGVGKVSKGEGSINLARGFRYAGAPNVLFSLWQVNDKSTAQLMEYYYKNLKKTRSRDVSLHKASLDYLNNDAVANPQKSPYYWGAFVYYGATDVAQEPLKTYWYVLGIAGVLIIVTLAWFLNRRRA